MAINFQKMTSRYTPDPSSGGMIDNATGQVIMPGDANWNPEWSATQAQNQAAFAPGGRFYNEYQIAQGPWYKDPALMGAIGLPVGAVAAGLTSAADAADAGIGASADAADAADSAYLPTAEGDFGVTSTPIAGGATDVGSVAGVEGGVQKTATGILSNLFNKGGTTGILSNLGKGIGAATTAAGNNNNIQENAGLQANEQNIQGNSAFVNEELGLANEEDAQRAAALKNVYQASRANGGTPQHSPFDPNPPTLSPQYLQTIGNLANQGSQMLSSPATYQVSNLPKPVPYKPINIADVQGATGTSPGILQKIGGWLGPALGIIGAL